ncbi:putative lysine decarboxylase [Halobacteriovorax marinus SJ]|uniref:Cytokinin riboside 5'-monophosphate phosphoribohydrolase n=1 Tax=Halobacteriovorax marinus (strain ATCC BAA-682 / DSM 15412 / SJ) TaxID=862908 RepID=E1WZF6_HALMS|nr:TIGR00730 family Rossman fold protein [Halobacteriovorax marinus]CBW27845.1 putative lysine decarboxylase [Halobacteriovorax marinus SJ]
MKKVCVFCGSSAGKGDAYKTMAENMGEVLTQNNFGLVYGGASIGVMGTMADQVLGAEGEVWGVMPKSLVDWEVAHNGLTHFETVDSMHTRKQKMYDWSDAFVAMPGGFGTLDELCEILTWAQLKYHQKPCFLLNFNGFFDHLVKHFKHINKEGFLSDEHLSLITVVDSFSELENELKKCLA